jgi:hypothetical protein
MLDRPLPGEVAADRRVTLGGSRYILVEFPRLITFQAVAAALRRVIETGLVPVLAHPERACCSPEAVVLAVSACLRRWTPRHLSTRVRPGLGTAERGLADIRPPQPGDDRRAEPPHDVRNRTDRPAQCSGG